MTGIIDDYFATIMLKFQSLPPYFAGEKEIIEAQENINSLQAAK